MNQPYIDELILTTFILYDCVVLDFNLYFLKLEHEALLHTLPLRCIHKAFVCTLFTKKHILKVTLNIIKK